MTWEPRKLRWRKMHRGKVHTISCEALGVPPTKEQSYQAANAWWREHGLKIAQSKPRETLWTEDGHPVMEVTQAELLKWAVAAAVERNLPIPDEIADAVIGNARREQLERGVLDLLDAPKVPEDQTLGYQVGQWLRRQETKVKAKEMTPGRYDNVRRCVNIFRDFAGASMLVATINEQVIDEFYAHCSGKMVAKMEGKGGWSADYAKSVLDTAKVFIKHLWSRKLIDLPRNLDEQTIKVRPKVIKSMPMEDFKKMYKKATGQLRLHLLMMANCGMRSTDISDLVESEVDWTKGRIRRKRSKTRIHNAKDVPIVDYLLWDETFALLKEYRSDGKLLDSRGDKVVLVTKSGGLWAWEEMVKEKLRCSDNLATNYNRLRHALKIEHPLSSVRKMGATILESDKHYGRYASHYLGESPRGITAKHYAAPSVELFDDIIRWLGRQFGF